MSDNDTRERLAVVETKVTGMEQTLTLLANGIKELNDSLNTERKERKSAIDAEKEDRRKFESKVMRLGYIGLGIYLASQIMEGANLSGLLTKLVGV